MVDFSNYGNIAKQWLGSGIGWLTIGIVLVIIIFFFIGYFSRKGKLKYNCLEIVRYGNGKVGLNTLKAGFFQRKTFMYFFDYGRETVVKTSNNKIIQGAKTNDLHDIFGKKGFLTIRNPKDPKILVPIKRVDFDNLKLLLEIAPSDYREASTKIFLETVEETKGTWEKILPYVAIGMCVILCIITVVVTMQMTNNATDKVGKMLIQGCTNVQNTKGGTSP
jgi:hypothetical protein